MQFRSSAIPEHDEVPVADDGRWEQIVEQWSQKSISSPSTLESGKAVYVLSVGYEKDDMVREAQLREISELVEAQGDTVVGEEIYCLTKFRAKTLLGKGFSREVATRARECGAELLVIDAELTPSQMRNLEDLAGISICDREAIILNVFLRHASTRLSRVQVEIARMEYLRPRIRGVGINMDQQMGGVPGARGPGETASELMVRQIDGRLAEMRKVERRLRACGQRQRQGRSECQRVALVGYTNAGKSTLMNALTEANVSARNKPFETLDTTSRSLSRHGENILISDTVGFIRRLPERLLASFETTLAEVREASLLLIVTDVSDYEWREQLRTTVDMLEELGADGIPRYYAFSKIDLANSLPSEHDLRVLSEGHPFNLMSALDCQSVAQLKRDLLTTLRQEQIVKTLFLPYEASEVFSAAYGQCRILETESCETGLRLKVQAYPRVLAKIEQTLERYAS